MKTRPARATTLLAVTLSGMALLTGCGTSTSPAPNSAAAASIACRQWDTTTDNGLFDIEYGTVKSTLVDYKPDGEAVLADQFADFDKTLKALTGNGQAAYNAARTPGLDTKTYRALRDLGTALFTLESSVRMEETLDARRIRIPAVDKARGNVAAVCKAYI